MDKSTLQRYEDNAAKIITHADGSVTFVFDEPGNDPETGERFTNATTISKADYEEIMDK